MTNETNKPVKTINDGWLKVSIWKNEGENGVFYSATPSCTYKDQQGQLQDGNNLTSSEPLRMAHLLTKAHDFIIMQRAKDRLDAQAAELEQEPFSQEQA